MDYVDAMGFAAAGLVLTTFCMTSMRSLRCVALLSNFAFIGYGWVGDLLPVIWLHGLLVPVNFYYLMQTARSEESRLVK